MQEYTKIKPGALPSQSLNFQSQQFQTQIQKRKYASLAPIQEEDSQKKANQQKQQVPFMDLSNFDYKTSMKNEGNSKYPVVVFGTDQYQKVIDKFSKIGQIQSFETNGNQTIIIYKDIESQQNACNHNETFLDEQKSILIGVFIEKDQNQMPYQNSENYFTANSEYSKFQESRVGKYTSQTQLKSPLRSANFQNQLVFQQKQQSNIQQPGGVKIWLQNKIWTLFEHFVNLS